MTNRFKLAWISLQRGSATPRLGRGLLAAAAASTALVIPSLARAVLDATDGSPAEHPAANSTDETVATFIGLRQLGDAKTLIYVELTNAVEPKLTSKGRTLEFLLPNTKVTLRNNRRPLLARHFDSVVNTAQLVPAGKDLKLVIELREDAEPKSRVVQQAQGATFEVELARPKPAGN